MRLTNLVGAMFLAVGCATIVEREPATVTGAPTTEVDAIWADFCHYVVLARPALAVPFGQRLLNDATPQQLDGFLKRPDADTRRALTLLDQSALPIAHPDLGEVWAQLRARAASAGPGASHAVPG